MKRRTSSDNSGDDIPIVLLKESKRRKLENDSKMKELYRYHQEKCEFCEKLLFSSYDLLVHNASHIIIPLKEELVQCSQCSLYFPNDMDLEIHTKIYHFEVSDILKSLITIKPIVECDNSVTELVMQNNEKKLEKIINKKAVVECDSTVTELINAKQVEKLKDFVTKQPVIKCEDTLKILHAGNLKSDSVNLSTGSVNNVSKVEKQDLIKNIKIDIEEHEDINENVNPPFNIESALYSGNIRSRLIFEDDDESDFEEDIIINKKTSLTDQNDEKEEVFDLTIDSDDDSKENEVIPKVATDPEEDMTPAVHYEELIAPELLKCERCGMTFVNRYDLVIHETVIHLQVKKGSISRSTRVCTVCDKLIVGNHWTLKHHMENEHPNVISKHQGTFNLKICTKCHLKYYFYPRHCKNYHYIYNCHICSKPCESESQLAEHIQTCKSSINSSVPQIVEDRLGMEKIIKVCDLCSLFLKNTAILKYVPLRNYSVDGKRVTCDRCEKQFFVVKLIKVINKNTIVQPCYEYRRKVLPPISNVNRLKKIQRRFKMMNKKCT